MIEGGFDWERQTRLRSVSPLPRVWVTHRDGVPTEVVVPRDEIDASIQAVLIWAADTWGHPVRCDRLQPYRSGAQQRTRGLRVARLRRFRVAEVKYIETPHGPEPFGYRCHLPSGRWVDLDDSGAPDPWKLKHAGTLSEWLVGPEDVVCGDHPRAPIAEADNPDRFERFPERSVYIPELRAWPREGGAYVTRHRNREGV